MFSKKPQILHYCHFIFLLKSATCQQHFFQQSTALNDDTHLTLSQEKKQGKWKPKSHLSTQKLSHAPLCNSYSSNLALVLTSQFWNQGKQPCSRNLNLFLYVCFMLLKKYAIKKSKYLNSSFIKKINICGFLFFKSQSEWEHAFCSKVGLVAGGHSSGPTSCTIR